MGRSVCLPDRETDKGKQKKKGDGRRETQVSTEIGASCTCLIWKRAGIQNAGRRDGALGFAPVYKRYVVYRCRGEEAGQRGRTKGGSEDR